MTFPIDVESTLQQYADDTFFHEFLALYLPVVNDCYQDGRKGEPFTFKDEQFEAGEWSKATGKPITPWARTALHKMIEFCRDAYEKGQAAGI